MQIGRGPATVIGKTVAVSQAALRSCSGRSFFARKSRVRPCPGILRGFFVVRIAELSSTQIFAGIVFRFRGTGGRPFTLVRLFLAGPGGFPVRAAADRDS